MIRYLLALLLLTAASSSLAFNFHNHRVICQMAYEQVSPAVQKKIDHLVSQSPFNSFANACPWPDQIRQQPQHKHTKTWHYVNVPRTAKKVSLKDCPSNGCVLSAIPLMLERMRKNQHTDWQSLLFLSHFVGDLHQPLHVSFADDWGGNGTKVTFRKKNTNLHAIWDGAFLKRQKWPVQSERLLHEITPQQARQWRKGSIENWATESLTMTHDAYRLLPPSNKVGNKYVEFFRPKLEQQMQKASVRLALLLEEIYK